MSQTDWTGSRMGTCAVGDVRPALVAWWISCVTVASPPRVGSRMKRKPGKPSSALRQRQHARCIGLQIAAQAELFARQHHRNAMIANRPLTISASPHESLHAQRRPRIACRCRWCSGTCRRLRRVARPSCRRRRRPRRFLSRRARSGDDAIEHRELETFLEEHAEAQILRYRARHGDIVGRAVHRQRTDVATGNSIGCTVKLSVLNSSPA